MNKILAKKLILDWYVLELRKILARNAAQMKKWRKKNPEKQRQIMRNFRHRHPDTKRRCDLAWRVRHRELLNKRNLAKYHSNKKKISEQRKVIRAANPERARRWARESFERNKETIRASRRGWRKRLSPERLQELKAYAREYPKRRAAVDPAYKIFRSLAPRLSRTVRGRAESKKLLALIGCDANALRAHLESKWQPGMTWQNYGYGEGKWVVDHIKPVSDFNMALPEDQKKCWHFSNLQPLLWRENLMKGPNFRSQLQPS